MSAPLALIAIFATIIFNFCTKFDTLASMEHFITGMLLMTALTVVVKIANAKTNTLQKVDEIDPRVNPLRCWLVTKLLNLSPYMTTSDAANAAAVLDANSKLRRWTNYDSKLLRRQVTSYQDVRSEKLMDLDDLAPVLVEMPMGGMQCAVM